MASPLIEDRDIERAALHMIMVHGILAEAAARKRAHTLTLDGQANAAQLWQQIVDAIAELLKP